MERWLKKPRIEEGYTAVTDIEHPKIFSRIDVVEVDETKKLN